MAAAHKLPSGIFKNILFARVLRLVNIVDIVTTGGEQGKFSSPVYYLPAGSVKVQNITAE